MLNRSIFPPHEIRDPGLGDTEELCCFALGDLSIGDVSDELLHECRPDLHVLGRTRSVFDGDPDAVISLGRHGFPFVALSLIICL